MDPHTTLLNGFWGVVALVGAWLVVGSRRRSAAMKEVFDGRGARPADLGAVREIVRHMNEESDNLWFSVNRAVYRAFGGRWLILCEGTYHAANGRSSSSGHCVFVIGKKADALFFERYHRVFRKCVVGAKDVIYTASVCKLRADESSLPLAGTWPALPVAEPEVEAEAEGVEDSELDEEVAEPDEPRGPPAVCQLDPLSPTRIVLDTSDGEMVEHVVDKLVASAIKYDVLVEDRDGLEFWILKVGTVDQVAALANVEAQVEEDEIDQAIAAGRHSCPKCGSRRVVLAVEPVEHSLLGQSIAQLCRGCGHEW